VEVVGVQGAEARAVPAVVVAAVKVLVALMAGAQETAGAARAAVLLEGGMAGAARWAGAGGAQVVAAEDELCWYPPICWLLRAGIGVEYRRTQWSRFA
jgi:hypothetical protein